MIRSLLCAVLLTFPFSLSAHEMLPTYPVFQPSYVKGLYETNIRMFNKREDVEYYEISVWDEEWNPIPFAISSNVMKIPYLSKVSFDLYIRGEDKNNVRYICSQSKLRKQDVTRTAISTKICSKIK